MKDALEQNAKNQHFISLATKNAIDNNPHLPCTPVSVHLLHREHKPLRSRAQTFVVVIKNEPVAYCGADYPSW